MMGDRPAQAPAEYIIWGSTAALALVSGLGAAFALWTVLHRSPAQSVADAAVAALTVGFGLIGVAVGNRTARLFLVVASAMTLAAFFLGGDAFSALTAA